MPIASKSQIEIEVSCRNYTENSESLYINLSFFLYILEDISIKLCETEHRNQNMLILAEEFKIIFLKFYIKIDSFQGPINNKFKSISKISSNRHSDCQSVNFLNQIK